MVNIVNYITRQSHKPLILIPIILMILSLLYLGVFGLNEGIDLKGGTLVTVELKQPMTETEITNTVQNGLGVTDVETSLSDNTAIITISGDVDQVNFEELFSTQFNILSFRSVGALLSNAAMTQIIYALLFAFIFMAGTVFYVFRDLVPSVAIILSAVCNLSVAVGSMSLFGIPLSIASVGALLMLIGYGVDTDILLTTRLLKRREGSLEDRAEDALKTGVTLTFAALAAMIVLFVVVKLFIPTAQVLEDISAVLIMGLISDLLSTWFMNLGILKWHMERGGHN
ncbi:protein translocase subunit SecF [Methanosphaera sp. WGK6]|uniref:protein translocase subunit SecF n=1 Tax=Methanosphaera sp. WGK6 TaxID=1561964 RepID=UPI00084CC20E|nr:protein translocase subunit SecF [Methanosphaera sp. WGK6]OED30145.1 preprotein translocase subunit SecF [Methanosphaera sp. WGK6]